MTYSELGNPLGPFLIGIVANKEKEGVPAILEVLLREGTQLGARFIMDEDYFGGYQPAAELKYEIGPFTPGTRFIVCLGGDGTILAAARKTARMGIPLLSVNLGRLGFMTELEPEELVPALPDLMAGKYRIEETFSLQTIIEGHPELDNQAWNDVVISPDSAARPLYIDLIDDTERICLISGDGLVISTTRGSTAYALAAGAPLIHPDVPAMVVTFLAPHSLTIRPLVFPISQELTVRIRGRHTGIRMAFDGQVVVDLGVEAAMVIKRGAHPGRMIRFKAKKHFARLREKLYFGASILE